MLKIRHCSYLKPLCDQKYVLGTAFTSGSDSESDGSSISGRRSVQIPGKKTYPSTICNSQTPFLKTTKRANGKINDVASIFLRINKQLSELNSK